jgi:hypothetical protein
MIEKIRKTRAYLDYLEEHYNNVQRAWDLIKEKCKDMRFIYDDFYYHQIDARVKNHDDSKLSKLEFCQYREFFYPVNEMEKKNSGFKEAWDNHIILNAHHWENWAKNPDLTHKEIFVVENIIDLVAMGFRFQDNAKDYFVKNKLDNEWPDWAVKLAIEIFKRIYID